MHRDTINWVEFGAPPLQHLPCLSNMISGARAENKDQCKIDEKGFCFIQAARPQLAASSSPYNLYCTWYGPQFQSLGATAVLQSTCCVACACRWYCMVGRVYNTVLYSTSARSSLRSRSTWHLVLGNLHSASGTWYHVVLRTVINSGGGG